MDNNGDNGASRQQIIAVSMWEGSFQDNNGASRGQQIISDSLCGKIASRDTNKYTTSALSECKKKFQWRVLFTKNSIITIA